MLTSKCGSCCASQWVGSVSIGKGQLINPAIVPAGSLTAGMRAVAQVLGVNDQPSFFIQRTLKDGSREERDITGPELDALCDISEHFTVSGSFTDGARRNLMLFAGEPGYAEVRVTAEDATTASAMLAAFTAASRLSEYLPIPDRQTALGLGAASDTDDRSPSDTSALSEPTRRLTVFLSHRFTPANSGVATTVQAFLNALGVEVVTGQDYEPRSVSTKVAERLSRVDAVVLLVGADGESPWTRDEVARAQATGADVIPIVEDGSAFSPGLFGDLEYITFQAGHIGDAFLALAQAVHYIRVMGRAH